MVPGLWAFLRISRVHLSRGSALVSRPHSSAPFYPRHQQFLLENIQLPHEVAASPYSTSDGGDPGGDSICERNTSIFNLPTPTVVKPAGELGFEGNIDRASYYPEAEKPCEDLSEIFEEDGEEYAMMQSAVSTTLNHASTQSTGVLQKLVQDGLYDQAYEFLKEVQSVGTSVPFSFLYEKPAIAVISDSSLSVEQKLERFTAWFSLIPPDHIAVHINNFEELRRLLLQAPLIQLPFIMRFGFILAEKGYADRLSVSNVIPLVLRCIKPDLGRIFLDNFCQANERYLFNPDNKLSSSRAIFRMKKTKTNVLGQAVRALAYSGRLHEAVALLPDPENPSFQLTKYTYNTILRRCWAFPPEIRQHNVDLIKRLRGSTLTCTKTPSETLDVRELELELSVFVGDWTVDPVDFGTDLVAALRYLKKHVVTKYRSEMAHPLTIVNFMSSYLATGRTRALKMLLDKAIRKSFTATGNFIFAEMLFYRRMNLGGLVVKTFVDHFWMCGVPREELLKRYIRFKTNIDAYDPSSGDPPPLKRFYASDPSVSLPRGKLWPRLVHCNLVWDALVGSTSGDRELKQLYSKLISFAENGSDLSRTNGLASTVEFPIGRHWKSAVGAASFTPFMHRLMCSEGPTFGVQMLRDMLRLRVIPTVYHYTVLCGFYARRGDVEKVFLILDGMERRLKRLLPPEFAECKSPTMTTASAETTAMEEAYQLPQPTLATYTTVLRGFLIGFNMRGAEMAAKRLTSHADYAPGAAGVTDQAIEDWKEFKKAGAAWVYPNRKP